MQLFFEIRSSTYTLTKNPYLKYNKKIAVPYSSSSFKARYLKDEVRSPRFRKIRFIKLYKWLDCTLYLVLQTETILILSLQFLRNFKTKRVNAGECPWGSRFWEQWTSISQTLGKTPTMPQNKRWLSTWSHSEQIWC